jgi:hypothetical protein
MLTTKNSAMPNKVRIDASATLDRSSWVDINIVTAIPIMGSTGTKPIAIGTLNDLTASVLEFEPLAVR